MNRLYGPIHRSLQDRFDTRRLADNVEARLVLTEISPEHKSSIESRDTFFLSTIDHRGRPTVSFKGGDPGFILRKLRSRLGMHTVCETHAFRRAAAQAGMSEDEISDLVGFLAENPMAGDETSGTGGCRKVRVRGHGKGKSGGYRTITFFTGETLPVFLITVFAKGERANLS
jgi:hypothetical protein